MVLALTEILPHLFTPFTQADNALNRENSGLGLGLSMLSVVDHMEVLLAHIAKV